MPEAKIKAQVTPLVVLAKDDYFTGPFIPLMPETEVNRLCFLVH